MSADAHSSHVEAAHRHPFATSDIARATRHRSNRFQIGMHMSYARPSLCLYGRHAGRGAWDSMVTPAPLSRVKQDHLHSRSRGLNPKLGGAAPSPASMKASPATRAM
eukprot:1758213-Amphidinium_carterae.1